MIQPPAEGVQNRLEYLPPCVDAHRHQRFGGGKTCLEDGFLLALLGFGPYLGVHGIDEQRDQHQPRRLEELEILHDMAQGVVDAYLNAVHHLGQDAHQLVGVVDGQDGDNHVICGEADSFHRRIDGGKNILLAQHDALAGAGGAGGKQHFRQLFAVADDGVVVAVALDTLASARQQLVKGNDLVVEAAVVGRRDGNKVPDARITVRNGFDEFFVEALAVHDGACIHHGDKAADLLRVQLLVHGYDHASCGKCAQICAYPLRRGFPDDNDLFAAQTHSRKSGSRFPHLRAERGIGHALYILALVVSKQGLVPMAFNDVAQIRYVPYVGQDALHAAAVYWFVLLHFSSRCGGYSVAFRPHPFHCTTILLLFCKHIPAIG